MIFDLDGTLADTAPDLLAATNAVLGARGRARLDLDHLRHMVGFGARALIVQAMEASGTPVTEAQMLLDPRTLSDEEAGAAGATVGWAIRPR